MKEEKLRRVCPARHLTGGRGDPRRFTIAQGEKRKKSIIAKIDIEKMEEASGGKTIAR